MSATRGGETRMLIAIGLMIAPVGVLVGTSLALGGRHPGAGAFGGIPPLLFWVALAGAPFFIAGVVLLVRAAFSEMTRRD